MDGLKFWLRILFLVIPAAYLLNFAYALLTDQSGGTFGDTFGAANALLSGAALMMLIYAVILQREELSLVKEERDQTRAILQAQEVLHKEQQAGMQRQLFAHSFYAQLTATLDERERLASNFVNGADKLQRASRASRVLILDMPDEGSSPLRHVEKLKRESYDTYFFIDCLITLAHMPDSLPADDPDRHKFIQTVNALINPEIAILAAHFHAKVLYEGRTATQFAWFFDSFNISEFLDSDLREAIKKMEFPVS